jgi:hypothetical protein
VQTSSQTVPPSPRSSRLAGVVCVPPLAALVAPLPAGHHLPGTCARPGPPDRDPTARVGLDPSPRGSNPRCRARKPPGPPDLDPSNQIRQPRVKPATTGQTRLDLGSFAKKTPRFFRFTSRSFHLRVFLAVRSCFFRFNPGSLAFFTV